MPTGYASGMVAGTGDAGRGIEVSADRPDGPAPLLVDAAGKRRIAPTLGAAAVLGAAGGLLYAIDPGGGPVLCPFRALTGFACPGCGTTRMLHHLLHGDVTAAFSYNPLTFLLLPVALWLAVGWLRNTFGGPRMSLRPWPAAWGWVATGVLAVYWVVRNVPVDPFRALALPS